MANPFDQFDELPQGNVNPFDQFDEEEESSWKDKLIGGVETGLGMVAGIPSQIVGGLVGGSQALVNGVDAGMDTYNKIQDWNFGAGAYTPSTAKGQEYSENVGNLLQKPVDWAGQAGEAVGGNAGRYVGELLAGSAMELIEPTVIYTGARSLAKGRKAKPSVVDKIRTEPRGLEVDVTFPDGTTDVGRAYDGQMNLFDQFDERSPISPYQTEMAPDMWRVDENGIPIRADLSMELQNLQQPLQRNLWGDEVDANFPRDPNKPLDMATGDITGYERMSDPASFRNDPENARGLTEAIDVMPEGVRNRVDGKFAPGTTRQSALDRLRGESPASNELKTAVLDAEISQWLQENKRPVPLATRARRKRQSGGVWFGDLGQSKNLQDLVETLPYRFPALEKLPNKEEFTVQQLQQSINRQEVSEAERTLLQRAYNQVTTEGRTKANAAEFVEAVARLSSDYSLRKATTAEYASFGINRLGRDTNRAGGIDIVPILEQMTDAEVADFRVNGNVPERLQHMLVPSEGGVGTSTNLWKSPIDLSVGVRNHFKDPSYFGHTRNFTENGQRYVVEIQSDLVQKYKKAGNSKLASMSFEELQDLQIRTNNFVDVLETALDTQNFDPLWEVTDELFVQDLARRFSENGGDDRSAASSSLNNLSKVLEAIDNEVAKRRERPTIDTMSKNWFQRLVREELADASKNGETTVRFATADTMAAVEGWIDLIDDAKREKASWERQVKAAEEVFESYQRAGRNTHGVEEDVIYYKGILKEVSERLEKLISSGKRFDENVQGIYDRYQKDVTKYLSSIGGKPVVDDKGHTWIEVPVEKHRQRPIMFGQRGVLKIDWSDVNKIDNASSEGDLIPANPEISSVLEKARTEKDGKQWTYVQSGSTSTAMKSGSSAIKAASQIVQNALKRADLAIRNVVFPAEGALRGLSKQEISDLATIMKDEMFNGVRYDGTVLANNLSVKQLQAYTRMRNLFDRTLDAQNEARLAKGQEPISPNEAYLSSRWEGDFRRPIYDQDGKLVWYLAAQTKLGLEAQSKALKSKFPDLVIDPKKDHTVSSRESKTDLQSMYSTMLDILGRNDPAIQKIQQAIEEQTVAQGSSALAQEKHFESKANIRGFTGDRPGKGGSREAVAMFQQQIQYAKNALKWSELQKAAEDIKSIVSDPVLQDTQPNNVKYIREYFKNAVGMGESQLSRALGNALRDGLGLSPAGLDKAVGNAKSFFIMQKLAASPGYVLSNMIQAGNTLPYLANLRSQGYKGNPAVAILMGMPLGMMMGVGHMLKAVGGEYIDRVPVNQFYKDAFKYAEQNGVTARSVYDEAPLNAGFGVIPKVANIAAKTMTTPETFVRSTAFMTYVQMLKDSGKFTDNSKLFQKAEELVNKSMVDYRETERPLMFSKAGTVGNFMNTLQTYPMSFYNQWAYMVKEALEGRPQGLLALAAFQYAVAGALGIPGFQDAEELYKYIKDELVSTSTWNEMAKSPFLSDPKLWMIENLGESSVYGALSDTTGLGMTARVAAPGGFDMAKSPTGPVRDIAKQVGSAVSAVLDPTNPTKLGQAAMNSAPVGFQGLLETAPFMEGITYVTRPDGTKVFMKTTDLEDRSGAYARTPEEVTVRRWGIRSQKEVKERDIGYATKQANQTLDRKTSELGSKIYNAARNGDTKRVKELTQLYVDLTGKELSDDTFTREITEEFYTDIEKNAPKSGASPRKLLNAAKMQKLLESR